MRTCGVLAIVIVKCAVAALLVALSVPLAGLFGLDFIPYTTEKRVPGAPR